MPSAAWDLPTEDLPTEDLPRVVACRNCTETVWETRDGWRHDHTGRRLCASRCRREGARVVVAQPTGVALGWWRRLDDRLASWMWRREGL